MSTSVNDIQKLLDKRNNLRTESRAIVDLAVTETRAMTADEQVKYDQSSKDVDAITATIFAKEKDLEQERSIAEEVANRPRKKGDSTDDEARAEFQVEAYRSYLEGGTPSLTTEQKDELRALQAGADVKGGYTVAPEDFKNQLIKFVDDEVQIRGLATVHKVDKAVSLGAPSLDTDVSDSDWTTELQTGGEDDDMAFGKRNLHPHPLAKRIKISNQLIEQSLMPIEQLVLARLGYKNAVTQEKAFMTGTGFKQPLGVFTASAEGISTGRDVSTGNTSSAMTFDGLKACKYSLKGQYQKSASTKWMFHRDGIAQIAKEKDGNGRYIWEDSVKVNDPDILLGIPALQSEFAPNTFTSGLYVGILGDWKNYWIADAMDLIIKVLDQLYAETNQMGYISRTSSDGMPVLEEAFARVKLG